MPGVGLREVPRACANLRTLRGGGVAGRRGRVFPFMILPCQVASKGVDQGDDRGIERRGIEWPRIVLHVVAFLNGGPLASDGSPRSFATSSHLALEAGVVDRRSLALVERRAAGGSRASSRRRVSSRSAWRMRSISQS
jgi:hypothetical protein